MRLKKWALICKALGSIYTFKNVFSCLTPSLLNFRLVCEITYTTPDQKSMSYRKFYRFQVLKPLDVKTKFYNAEVGDKFASVHEIIQWPVVWFILADLHQLYY